MNKKHYFIIIMLYVLIFSSCLNQRQRRTTLVNIPETEFHNFTLSVKLEDVIETRGGAGSRVMPGWLRAYINGGIPEVEKIEAYAGKYIFIGMSEGLNFAAMNRWAENFSPVRDTTMLAAARIEKRMLVSASLYPDDVYGSFFESMIMNAYSRVYPEAVKEDTYWVKIRTENEDGPEEIYVFYVLISIDRTIVQDIVRRMIRDSTPSSFTLTQNQRNAIDDLRTFFFEGF